MAGFGTAAILDSIVSHVASLGFFQRVNTHEMLAQPDRGLTCAVWVDKIEPAPSASGLDATTSRLVFMVRIYSNARMEPVDALDPELIAATDAVFAAFSGDFDLGGSVRSVDLLGEQGEALNAQAGYINVSDTILRVMTITLPLIVNDVWAQVS